MTITHSSPLVAGQCDLLFADDIALMGDSNGELQDFAERLVDKSKAYGMKISTENSQIMTNSSNDINADMAQRLRS